MVNGLLKSLTLGMSNINSDSRSAGFVSQPCPYFMWHFFEQRGHFQKDSMKWNVHGPIHVLMPHVLFYTDG